MPSVENVNLKRAASDLWDSTANQAFKIRKVEPSFQINKMKTEPNKKKKAKKHKHKQRKQNVTTTTNTGQKIVKRNDNDHTFLELDSDQDKKALKKKQLKKMLKKRRELDNLQKNDVKTKTNVKPLNNKKLEKSSSSLPPKAAFSSKTVIVLSDTEDNDDNTRLTFKKDHNKGLICINENRVPLHVHHLNCLNTKNGWLNDTVINYALDMLKDKYNNTQMYISSTFFFTRLQQAAANASENYYEILKKWFRKVHLFNKSLWLIPVFQKSHWFLMAVTSLQNKKHFSIVCMDSLGKDRTECLQLLEKFIARKYKDDRINGEWHPPKLLTAKIPRQTNGNDCGLHLIRSAELLLSNKKKTIQLAMGKLDKEKTKKLFERVMIRNRQQLKKDILEYTKSINKKQ